MIMMKNVMCGLVVLFSIFCYVALHPFTAIARNKFLTKLKMNLYHSKVIDIFYHLGTIWNKRSKESKRLLSRMLNKNSKERPSALEVLNSDWIKNTLRF